MCHDRHCMWLSKSSLYYGLCKKRRHTVTSKWFFISPQLNRKHGKHTSQPNKTRPPEPQRPLGVRVPTVAPQCDLNVDWNSLQCPLRNILPSITEACGLAVDVMDLCVKAISVPVGCSDHNLIAMVRKTRVPKSGRKIEVSFIEDVHNICWADVLMSNNPDDAVEAFSKMFSVRCFQ